LLEAALIFLTKKSVFQPAKPVFIPGKAGSGDIGGLIKLGTGRKRGDCWRIFGVFAVTVTK